MSYSGNHKKGEPDRYGSTPIKDTAIDNLSIAWDYDDDAEDKTQRYPVLLYTPWMKSTNIHYHIMLDREQTAALRDWLTEFLDDTKPVP